MAIKGDTVRFEVNFVGFDGVPLEYEANKVTFKIYDGDEKEIFKYELSEAFKNGMNSYFYDFTIPSEFDGTYYYEFEGKFRANIYVARDDFNVTFQ